MGTSNGQVNGQGHSHHHHHTDWQSGGSGTFVTILGVFVNVFLTIVKGAAGWYLNSLVLVADAGHSLSDLTGDFVTLFFYSFSRRAASKSYPFGYGKFESLGTSTVAAFLLVGAYAIGKESYMQMYQVAPEIRQYLPFLPEIQLDSQNHHSHGGGGDLDVNAAWVAVLSILIKEAMYRVSARVAEREKSPVLLANALHHRSDMYSSVVSLVAILVNAAYPSLPMDPIGGLCVSALIVHQSFELLQTSFGELTDQALAEDETDTIRTGLSDALATAPFKGSKVVVVRALRRGARIHVEADISLPDDVQKASFDDLIRIERDCVSNCKAAGLPNVADVRLSYRRIGQ